MTLPDFVISEIEKIEYDREYTEELRDMELSVRMEIRKKDAADWKAKTKDLKCQICGGDIHVERVVTTQAVPKYCHKLSCKAKAKAENSRRSKARKMGQNV
jgi:hypothetical protein